MVHYLCFYADEKTQDELETFPSALPKIDYISSTLKEAGKDVRIVSACSYKRNASRSFDIVTNRFGIECLYIQRPWKLPYKLRILFFWFKVFQYIICNVKCNDTLLVYHSLAYIYPIRFARFFKKVRMTVEVEELFYTLFDDNKKFKNRELAFLKTADAYLLVNDLLAEKLKIKKPFLISYSAYRRETPINRCPYTGGKIHVVYAGCIEQHRKAAFMAVEAARYLSEKYHLHILGFGQKDDIEKLKSNIALVNKNREIARVTYEGSKYGREYSAFLSKCQIGLTCHVYNDKIPESADCTFPSKVFVYFLHGLKVVSFPLKCLEQSAVSEYVSFASDFSAKSLANAILKVDLSSDTPDSKVYNMHKEFVNKICKII